MSQKQSTEYRQELRNNTEIVANQLTLHSEAIQALSESELLMVNAANDRGNGNSAQGSRADAN
jgi:hypothetical protein